MSASILSKRSWSRVELACSTVQAFCLVNCLPFVVKAGVIHSVNGNDGLKTFRPACFQSL